MNEREKVALEALKPCPFCGVEQGDHDEGVPFLQIDQNEGYCVHCSNCGCYSGESASEAVALAAWNSRAALQAPSPLGNEDLGQKDEPQSEADDVGAVSPVYASPQPPQVSAEVEEAIKIEALMTAAEDLIALMDETPVEARLGDESDRVFSYREFAHLRNALAKLKGGA